MLAQLASTICEPKVAFRAPNSNSSSRSPQLGQVSSWRVYWALPTTWVRCAVTRNTGSISWWAQARQAASPGCTLPQATHTC